MPAIANTILMDGAATPLARTFAPAKVSPDAAMLENRSSGTYIGFDKLVYELSRPKGNSNVANRNLKLTLRIETPKLEVVSNNTVSGISPAPTVSYRPFGELTFVFPERSSRQDRKDLRALFVSLLNHASSIAAIEDLELPY